jgi:hypothetical protein
LQLGALEKQRLGVTAAEGGLPAYRAVAFVNGNVHARSKLQEETSKAFNIERCK